MAGARPSTDFLSRLAIRALGLGPAVAPRVPSVFEPPAPAGDPEGGDVERAVALALEPGPIPAAPARTPAPASPATIPGAFSSPPELRLAHPASADAPARPALKDVRPLEPNAPLAAVPAEPASASPTEGAAPVRQIELHRSPRQGLERAAPRAADGGAGLVEDGSFPAGAPEESSAQRRIGPRAIAREADEPARAAPTALEGALSHPSVPVMRPASIGGRGRRAQPSGQADPPAEPVVNVTIGRIDVRAAALNPAPAPRAVPRPEPPESLADYLKRRDGGR